MTLILQGYIQRSMTAYNLLSQICSEKGADVVLVSKQYRNREGPGWYKDKLGDAAIWIPDPRNLHAVLR